MPWHVRGCARRPSTGRGWTPIGTAAVSTGAGFIDPTPWVCPTEPCPAIIGSLLVYLDAGHMTRTFSAELAPYLGAALGP